MWKYSWIVLLGELVADLGLQLPATVTTLDDPVAGLRREELRLAPRAGIGAELALGERVWLRLGGLYNRSATPPPEDADDPTRETYLGVTGGLSFQSDRTVTSVGGFALWSSTDLYVLGAEPARTSNATARLYGGTLSFSYRL